jgi:hypothetical protein
VKRLTVNVRIYFKKLWHPEYGCSGCHAWQKWVLPKILIFMFGIEI